MTPFPWPRLGAVALWLAFAFLALTVIWRPDPWGWAYAVGWVILSLAEAHAIWRRERMDTISDRIHAWLLGRWWRVALLVAVMAGLAVHWLTGLP